MAGTGGDIGGHDRREADLKSKQAGQLASLSNSSIGYPLWERVGRQSVSMRECLRVSFMVAYTASEQAIQAVTYQ